ncbi:MAG: hypothetical protein COA80_13360 [Leeuwenhoekiella sp.]|nr:MAG: hypothetical protein COA80_13360 [Leeuwenhoekiella sp.]
MKILYRLGFYLGGFSIGLILLAFFIKGSGVELPSCDYLPNARLLKTIRNNGYALSPQAEKQLQELALDTSDLNTVFLEGEVDFKNSDPRKEPCGFYIINSQETMPVPLVAKVERCDEAFEVLSVTKK